VTPWQIIIPISTMIGGILIRIFYETVREQFKFKKELKDNNRIDVSGEDWHAAWQASVNNEVIINTEKISMVQKGQTVRVYNQEKSPENPEGGYLWEAQMQFFQGKSLMGWYLPKKTENITSKGIMFVAYHSARRTFYGKWVGASYDGDLANGFVVISKQRDKSLEELNHILRLHPDKVNVIFNSL
jgi:hypothetical protein